MDKFSKWLLISPALMFGIWFIGLFLPDFRKSFVNLSERLLKRVEQELERSL